VIDILIPVLGRPRNVTPLLESLKVTQTPYQVFFICSPGDTPQIEACLQTGHQTWIAPWEAGRGDFAKKINWAFRQTHSEWLFQGADDICFHGGWDTRALQVARHKDRQVIGTNDLHNSLVKRGGTSTHTLFTRRYIEEQGGTLTDGPGVVFHEGYDHQFVDMEFCEVAKRRGVWAFSKQSIVEHFHPHWGNADEDATYVKADRHRSHDMRLYRKRMGLDRQLTNAQRRMARKARAR
jgi:hypothetical protein